MSDSFEPPCVVCSMKTFPGFSFGDESTLTILAREFVDGILLGADESSKVDIRSFSPPRRRGVCVVERCARLVEAPCGACLGRGCQRCAIAAELRVARDRINSDRDSELADLGVDYDQIDVLVDRVISGLCADHVALGPVLARHWYGRRELAIGGPVADDACDS